MKHFEFDFSKAFYLVLSLLFGWITSHSVRITGSWSFFSGVLAAVTVICLLAFITLVFEDMK